MSESIPNEPVAPPVVIHPARLPAPPSAPLREIGLDTSGRITEDVLCRSCGYNLRGLPMSGECPECHAAVGQSVRGDLLQFCEPSWVERLGKAMSWLIAGVISAFAGVIVSVIVNMGLTMFAAASSGGAGIMGSMALSGAIQAAVQLAVACVFMVGFWMLTSPDPAEPADGPALSARTLARYLLLASLVSVPLTTFYTQSYASNVMTGGTAGPQGLAAMINSNLLTVIGVVAGVMGAVQIVGYVAVFVVTRRLAMRIPHPRLASQTKLVMWGLTVAMCIEVLATVVTTLFAKSWISGLVAGGGGAPSAAAMTGLMILSIGGCAVGLAKLTFGIWAFVLMFRFRSVFRYAAAQARATWKIADGACDA